MEDSVRRSTLTTRLMAVAVATVGVALVSASPALATASGSTIDSPDAATVVTATKALTISATVAMDDGDSDAVQLTVADPRGSSEPCHTRTLASATASGALSATLDPYNAYPASCGGADGFPAYNGTWTIGLTGDGATATRTFVMKVPPKAPSDLAVTGGVGTLHVTWDRNTEADVDAYAVGLDGADGVEHPSTDVCTKGSCSLDLPVSSAGSHTVIVAALRWTSYSDHTHLAPVTSSASGTSTAQGQPSTGASPDGAAPSSAVPASPKPTTGPARTSAPAAPQSQGPAFHYSPNPLTQSGFNNLFDDTKTRLSPLPGLNTKVPASGSASASVLPGDDGEVDGAYQSTLGYGETTRDGGSEANVTEHAGVPLASVADAIGVDPGVLWRSTAGAILLMLLFLHLRLWLGRRTSDWD